MSGRCDLPGLFRELVNIFRYRARTKSISVEAHISPEFPVVNLSEDHMRQILLNLVGNAVKFTDSGSVEFSAECRPDGNGTVALHLTVKDTGCGMTPDRLRTVFEPFDDGETTRGGNAYGGTGLGLPIVKRLVESCNGTINVESAPGKGTEVYLRIGHVQLADASEGSGGEPVKLAVFPKEFSVLIVDDVPVNLKVLSLRVKKMGIANVYSANSGEEALKLLEKARPCAVLTDMWMPGMNGADLARAIRQTTNCADVPVIAVTADSDARASFDMSNFSGMITKPVSVEKLRASLAKVAGSRGAA
jgi:CheY-like chemotaxis protein/two-component sensor histidine kinase